MGCRINILGVWLYVTALSCAQQYAPWEARNHSNGTLRHILLPLLIVCRLILRIAPMYSGREINTLGSAGIAALPFSRIFPIYAVGRVNNNEED